ncbi:hypothetical protein ACJIZ3_003644 [Penstemon smallii]|uniref:TF-B3 domain-containing protein n=1 Tax=Penstemon smallii TaxID=265156 RepID=A0ABD3UBU1_9LAMI
MFCLFVNDFMLKNLPLYPYPFPIRELDINQIPCPTFRIIILILRLKQRYGPWITRTGSLSIRSQTYDINIKRKNGEDYVEKFGSNVDRRPFKFFRMAERCSELCLILPKLFSSYPIMDPSGCFATVRTRLGAWKIWCIRNNKEDVDEKYLRCTCAPFDPAIIINLKDDDEEEEKEEEEEEEGGSRGRGRGRYIHKEFWKPHCLYNYKVACKGLSLRSPRLALAKGWSYFCVDNNLKEGDILDMKFVELNGQGMDADILHTLVDLNVGN